MAVGISDPGVSQHLLAYIQGPPGTVVGLIGEGSSRQLTANWESPFEQDSAGSSFERMGGLIQTATGATSKGTLQSTQVWNGNQPHTFTLVLEFYAWADADVEVKQAIIMLEQMASPEVNFATPFGRAPQLVSLQSGRMIMYPECHIEITETSIDGPKDSAGNPLRATVNLTIETKAMLNASDIQNTFG
ncbi:MAG: hypothetical protein OIF57_06745 [Marinobacterium sp.]|nr:hypothetical protein [Marinobacterium sp.]